MAVTILAALLLCPAPASAHAELVSSDPQDGSRLEAAPGRIVLTFTEPVELGPGHLQVFAPDGNQVEKGHPAHLDGRAQTATVDLRTGLDDGTYIVKDGEWVL